MIENLKRLREPVAWIVLAVTAASIVLAVVRFVIEVSTGEPLATAAQTMSLTVMNLTFVFLVVALAWAAVFVPPPLPRARLLVGWSAIVVTLGTLLTLFGAIGGLATGDSAMSVVFEFLGGVLDIVLKAVGTVTLWLMYRGVRGGRFQADVARAGAAADQQNPWPPTTWAPDAATGAVWTSAADAASGAPASSVGSPSTGSSWFPVRGGTEDPALPEGTDEVTRAGTSPDADPYRLDEE